MKFLRMARTGLDPVLIFALLNLLIFTLSRLGLSLWQADHLSAAEFPGMLLSGLRVDVATLCALEALPAFLLCLCVFPGCARILIALIRVYLTLSLAFVVLNEAATPAFMNEFGVRPNHLYVAYLKYPGEVAETLLNGHLLSSLLSLLLIGLALLLGWRLSGSLLKDYRPLSMKRTLAAFLILCAVVPLGMLLLVCLGARLAGSMDAFFGSLLLGALLGVALALLLPLAGATKLREPFAYLLWIPAALILAVLLYQYLASMGMEIPVLRLLATNDSRVITVEGAFASYMIAFSLRTGRGI